MSNNENPQWEYKSLNIYDFEKDIENGNKLGKEGWELAGVGGTHTSRAILKRKARPKPSYNPSYGR